MGLDFEHKNFTMDGAADQYFMTIMRNNNLMHHTSLSTESLSLINLIEFNLSWIIPEWLYLQ